MGHTVSSNNARSRSHIKQATIATPTVRVARWRIRRRAREKQAKEQEQQRRYGGQRRRSPVDGASPVRPAVIKR